MNWQKSAMEDLRKYNAQKESLDNARERIGALKYRFESVRCSSSDSTPVQGGASRIEDKMLDNIVERQRLTYTYHATKKLVALVERGLSGLDERERKVLDAFYINREYGHVENLYEELHVEKSRVYQIKNDALYKFTISSYGLIDY